MIYCLNYVYNLWACHPVIERSLFVKWWIYEFYDQWLTNKCLPCHWVSEFFNIDIQFFNITFTIFCPPFSSLISQITGQMDLVRIVAIFMGNVIFMINDIIWFMIFMLPLFMTFAPLLAIWLFPVWGCQEKVFSGWEVYKVSSQVSVTMF